ncbi:cystathionine gamma-synthase [Telmatospirillum sp.]|uniref:cystathionine gamma-synthase n=1 Tax=Telmatospirillum sp. TaxID=2079197 RepID=UPI0028464EE0|nr:cystathionine gamma-synthase [Telmatospirillum sp.]MDR3436382.1 cystathionine gamma-synthase [Telmatospirillum sp.]
MTKQNRKQDRTIAARAGVDVDPAFGAITPSLVTSSNFSFEAFNQKRAYDYTRSANPTRDLLARAIADLEGGYGAVITSTGMSALDLVFALLKPQDLIVAPHDCYGGTYRLLQARAEQGHFRVLFADLTDKAGHDAVFAAKPILILAETPSNPLLRITDLAALAARAKDQGVLLAADNTFLSPALQKPLDLGADIVVHSLTKYINGHSDVVGGAVVLKTAELHERFVWWANVTGITGAPFDSWLVLRGLRTLDLRITAQTKSAGDIARFLEGHPSVKTVFYPGLSSHPGHDLAARQQKGFGAMLSFELAENCPVDVFVNALVQPGSPFSLAESLGGFESLIAHPATMTHASMDATARQQAGITDGLLRVSVGLEAPQDLKKALKAAFAAVR